MTEPDRCDECGELAEDDCLDSCACPSCEGNRLLDDEADGYAERCQD